MDSQFDRTKALIGEKALIKLFNSKIAIFGIGGVGSFVVEALARVGIGEIDLIDNDKINITNINRQVIALHSTIGHSKVDVAKKRALDINPNIQINTFKKYYSTENSKDFNLKKYDYIIDAIDSMSSKIELIVNAKEANTPIISSMGTGNKLHPEMFEISDIYKTSVCPLARILRTELKKRKIKNLKVVYSKEIPIKEKGSRIPASISFTPSVAGLIIASEVVKDIIKDC
ncbi:tRNA threonylcarbamoyladenosine dehydratase [bacterium]|nr:tRNA threonylcarbamoyladenosine dehydratase [bacterium]